jgi:hypothetical protein
MTAQVAATRIARQMNDAEGSLDALIAQQAELMATIATASLAVNAPLAEAQPALLRLGRFQTQLLGARSELIRAHGLMLKVGQERGDLLTSPCPSNKGMQNADMGDLLAA